MNFLAGWSKRLDGLSAYDWALVVTGTMGFISFQIAQQHEFPANVATPWWARIMSGVGVIFLIVGLVASVFKAFPKVAKDNRAFVMMLLGLGLGIPLIQLAVHDYVTYMATLAGVLATALLALAVEGRKPPA